MLTLQGNELDEKYISNRKYEKLTNKKLILSNIMMTKDFLSKDFEWKILIKENVNGKINISRASIFL